MCDPGFDRLSPNGKYMLHRAASIVRAAVYSPDLRSGLAALLTGKAVRLRELAQRSVMPLDMCKEFLD